MLKMEEFKEVIEKELKDYLPGSFRDCVISFRHIQKVNIEREAMIVELPQETTAPVIYLDDFYADVANDEIQKTLEKLATLVVKSYKRRPVVGQVINNKEKIVYMLINKGRNEKNLKDIPHREFLDLAIVYKVIIENSEDGISSATITNSLADMMGLTEEELYKLATENTPIVFGKSTIPFFPQTEKGDMISPIIVTNEAKTYGAATLLYDDMMKTIASVMEQDFYILPSSIHETIIVPMENGDTQNLLDMVYHINRTAVANDEVLSDNIYVYHRETDEIDVIYNNK